MDDMMPDWDAYEHLMDITRFCNQADEHIKRLIENQQVMVQSINDLRTDIDLLNAKIELLESILES
jgi:hypothetical protein